MTDNRRDTTILTPIKKYHFWLICGVLIFVQLLFSLRFMGRQYFNLDEVSQIGFIAKKLSVGGILDYYLTSEVTNLPLFPLLAALWYRVVPYGEGWMRLLTVILTTGAIVFLIKMAVAIGDEYTGYLMAVLSVSSATIMQKCGLTFRVHAFWLLFTALVLYLYIKRQENQGSESWMSVICLGLAMAGLAWSHYFGCITIVYMFLMDVVLLIAKRIRIRTILSYVIAGGTLLPWFILMLIRRTMNLSEFWPKTPTFASIPHALMYIVSNDTPVYVILILGMITSVLASAWRILQLKPDFRKGFIRLGFAMMPLAFIVGNYVYSAHIASNGGIFVTRYFLSVVPAALLTVSLTIQDIIRFVIRVSTRDDVFVDSDKVKDDGLQIGFTQFMLYGSVVLMILFFIGAPNYYYDVKDEVSAPYDNTYGNVRDEVLSVDGAEEAIRSGRTVVAINANRANADGFEEYYFEYAGTGEELHVVSNDDEDMAERIKNADRIYIYQVMKGTPDVFTDLMGDDFEQSSFDKNLRLYEFERVK
ncbi:hypothetical protein SAMN06296386_10782 [Lachnospiraceae bacterium]|nr:hypothetical protein SAMN06296386_10782 [Lachnospiraceae bacterium]